MLLHFETHFITEVVFEQQFDRTILADSTLIILCPNVF